LGAQGEREGERDEAAQQSETAEEEIVVGVVGVGVAFVAWDSFAADEIDAGGGVGVQRAQGHAGAASPVAGDIHREAKSKD